VPSERRGLEALHDIREHIALAEEWLGDRSAEALAADRARFYAIVRCLEIISEAARRLDPAVRDRHPDQPWQQIMGAGNVFRHDYQNVEEFLVWQTVRNNLPGLLAVVEAEIQAFPLR
jgi:uncharacterized protein with HEPN domain